MPKSIDKLRELFSRFPTVGNRTAGRFVYYLIGQSAQNIDELIGAIKELKSQIKLCGFCYNPFEGEAGLCEICKNPGRNKQLLCVVEKEADLQSIENTKRYNGLYFILGGSLALRNINSQELRVDALKERVAKNTFTELIIATNPTPEGKSTSILIERALKELPQFSALKITHLAQGLPVGGELEYADEETLESAFDGRK